MIRRYTFTFNLPYFLTIKILRNLSSYSTDHTSNPHSNPLTFLFCPNRCARSIACKSFIGFQSWSMKMTMSAPVRFNPTPPIYKLMNSHFTRIRIIDSQHHLYMSTLPLNSHEWSTREHQSIYRDWIDRRESVDHRELLNHRGSDARLEYLQWNENNRIIL